MTASSVRVCVLGDLYETERDEQKEREGLIIGSPQKMDTDDANLEEDFDDGSDDGGEPDYDYLNDSAAPLQSTASRK